MNDLLDTYREQMLISLSAKDNNQFWPLGIPALSWASAHSILDQARTPDWNFRRGIVELHPTAVLCFHLYLTHGLRRLQWEGHLDRLDTQSCSGRLLEIVAGSRSNLLVPDRLGHRLAAVSKSPECVGLASAADPTLSSQPHLLELSALMWSLSEALCFFAHRIISERHGPYLHDSRVFVVRHFRNWAIAAHLDMEAHVPDALRRSEFSVVTEVLDPTLSSSFRSDMYGNPLFKVDLRRAVFRHVGLWRREGEPWSPISAEDLADLVTSVRHSLQAVSTKVEGLTNAEKCSAMAHTFQWIIEAPDIGSPTIEEPYSMYVLGDPRCLIDYYDWRSTPQMEFNHGSLAVSCDE